MTHSPTPTELLALRTANAALLNSPDSFCDMVATVVFALGSAQLLQSPETAAELARLRTAWQSARQRAAYSVEMRLVERRAHEVTAAELVALRARVAELEAAAEKAAAFCAERAEYVSNLRDRGGSDADYYRWTGHAAARRQLSDLLGLPVGGLAEDSAAATAAEGEYRYCGADLGRIEFPFTCYRRVAHKGPHGERPDPVPVEDPHDSELHHPYRLGRDIPEARNV
ncbi:hypothetical protein ABT024_07170 [Streptomyces sp. NPDC002812]|uniref:hypothetical protein n=1 Tax=Streptomyces sp. NPDC002812 TaxID=3154434 RepID=UPI00333346DF